MKLQTIKEAIKAFKEAGFGGWSDERIDAFWGSLTGDAEHKITQCMNKMDGKVDDPGAFCNALGKRAGYKPGEKEANTAGANGAVQRSGAKKECREATARLLEIKQAEDGRTFVPCIIIRQGMGNLKDKNYYTKDAIVSGVPVYEGKQAYFDHPTPTQDSEQPGRSVRDLMGHYEDCEAVLGSGGLMELRAKFFPEPTESIMAKVRHAVDYQKKYPNKDYVGISINGDGEGESMDYEEFIKRVNPSAEEMLKIKQVEGQDVNLITKLTDAFSADFVTAAGAGGRVLKENQKPIRRSVMGLSKFMKQFFMGIEENDDTKIQEAVKNLRESDEDEGDEDEKKKEGEKHKASAEKLHGYMKQMRKEMKKGEDEGDESYEKRMMMAAFAKHSEDEKKKESEDEDEAKKKKEADEKKKKGEHGKGDDDADDKGDKGKEGKKEMADIRKELAAIREEHEALKKENALLKVTKETKDRAAKVDKLLAESGLPMRVTKHARSVVEACKSEEEMKATIKEFQEAYTESQEEAFSRESGDGFGEKGSSEGSAGKNDDCF